MQLQLLFLSSLACLVSSLPHGHLPDERTHHYYQTNNVLRHYKPDQECKLPAASDMPSSALPPVSAGLAVFHVALGRGTQNYSCPTGVDPSTPPTAVGAVANLYNVTCMASACTKAPSQYPLDDGPALSLKFTPDPAAEDSTPIFPLGSGSVLSGHHYFSNATLPTFNLVQSHTNYGIYFTKKIANVTAPADAAKGTDGSTAVPWLKLSVDSPDAPLVIQQVDYRPNVKEVYRVNTAGGNAPKTCAGMPTAFQIQYAAEYWFYG